MLWATLDSGWVLRILFAEMKWNINKLSSSLFSFEFQTICRSTMGLTQTFSGRISMWSVRFYPQSKKGLNTDLGNDKRVLASPVWQWGFGQIQVARRLLQMRWIQWSHDIEQPLREEYPNLLDFWNRFKLYL